MKVNPKFSAYPVTAPNDQHVSSGMNIRTMISAMAMQGILSNCPQSAMHGLPEYQCSDVAIISIQMADALINELNEPDQP